MAAFSSFPLDSSSSLMHLPTSSTINKISTLFHQSNSNNSIMPHPQNPTSNFNHSSSNSIAAAMDSSSEVTDKATPAAVDKKRKCRSSFKGSSENSAQSKDKRRQRKSKEEKKEPPTDYIHVRARRGQATDNHSLAERVRRERISERMKLLQALVPGCDKVTGKALMLDEIINYVQSLQNQVEFLSMKIASVNPMFDDFGMDLESLTVRPDQLDVNNFAGLQECNNLSALNNYHLLENPSIFPQAQNPEVLAQGSRQGLWEMDEQRQKMIINQPGFSNNSFFSFH